MSFSENRRRNIVATLGYFLVVAGGAKLNGVEQVLEPLARLDLPDYSVPFIAWGEIVIGAMIARGPSRALGLLALVGWMLGALVVHLHVGDLSGAIPAALLLLIGMAFFFAGRKDKVSGTLVPTPLQYQPEGLYDALSFLLHVVSLAFLFRWTVGGLLFWATLPVLGIVHYAREHDLGASRLHCVLLYLLFYGYGIGGIWNFVGHFFMSDMVAASTGWSAGSPFQHELAFYHLGTGVAGLLCLWWRDRFWMAAGLVPSIFTYGAAFVHVREYLLHNNVAAANWSFSAIGANIIIPTAVLALLAMYYRRGGFVLPKPCGDYDK
jgi:hypothetical protein